MPNQYSRRDRDRKDGLVVAGVQPTLRPPSLSPVDAAEHVANIMRQVSREYSLVSGRGSVTINLKKDSRCEDKGAADHRNMIDLFVLPELSPIGYSEHTFSKHLPDSQRMGDFHRDQQNVENILADVARELDAFVCFGYVGCDGEQTSRHMESSNSTNMDGKQGVGLALTIRQGVLDNQGHRVKQYDKIHLCDYGACSETRFFTPGSALCSFTCRGFQVGIIICADMRNPDLSRDLTRRCGVDLIIQPAAFSRDISFRTWKSFRETRAVENSVYFLTSNYAGAEYGDSSFSPPWIDENHEPLVLSTCEGAVIGDVRREVLDSVRKVMPYHRQTMGSVRWRRS